MRRLLTFSCEGDSLGASLDEGAGETGILIVTGGSQTRIGSHRLFERLAGSLAREGFPCLRFDRRGIGDSGGEDPGFRGSGPDIAEAATAFREQVPRMERVIGLGLCDGATALALHAGDAGMDGLILANPWLVEAEADAPPPAAIKDHYRKRLTSAAGWKKLLTGGVSLGKLAKGISSVARGQEPSGLAQDVASTLGRARLPVALILASGDATAIAAGAEMKAKTFNGLIGHVETVDTDSHTFAKPGDEAALLGAVLAALKKV